MLNDFNIENKKVVVFGGSGLVGSNLVKRLKKINCDLFYPTSSECDLFNNEQLSCWFKEKKPDLVYMAAGKVGGILDNEKYPVEYCYDNTIMGINVIKNSYENNVKRLVYFSSSCVYPAGIESPMAEDLLLSGKIEPTNEGYALAKILVSNLCGYYNKEYGTDYITIVPCNIYGTGDNYDLEKGHVIGALINKFYNHKEQIEIWGHGRQRREVMHIEDLVDATIFLTRKYKSNEPINVGIGEDYSIKEIVDIIKKIVDYKGDIIYNTDRPIGVFRKLLDVTKIHSLGWKHKISIEKGLENTIKNYLNS